MTGLRRIGSVKEYFETLDQRFVADAAKGVEAVFQFDISGDGGGLWHVVVKDGGMSVHEGKHGQPSAVVTSTANDYVQIANGDIGTRLGHAAATTGDRGRERHRGERATNGREGRAAGAECERHAGTT